MVRLLALLLVLSAAAPRLGAQTQTFELGEGGQWVQTEAPEPGSDAAQMGEIRRLLADGRPGRAKALAKEWLEAHDRTDNPWLPHARLLLGDAMVAMGDEYDALFEYERVIRFYPASDAYPQAVARELEIGLEYAYGKRRKIFFGLLRIVSTVSLAEELLIRVQERLPGSELAERAGIELADFYYRRRDMPMAAEAYDLFLVNYPNSVHRRKAMRRRILANIAQYKGPQYDATSLVEAEALIVDFQDRYPLEAEEAGLSDALLARIDESQGAQMLEQADWYLRTGDPVSARFVLRRLVRRHPRTVASDRAREILQERGWSMPERAGDANGDAEGSESEGTPDGQPGGAAPEEDRGRGADGGDR